MSLKQQIRFNSKIIGNKHCRYNEGPLYPFRGIKQRVHPPNAASDQGLYCLLTEVSKENEVKIKTSPRNPAECIQNMIYPYYRDKMYLRYHVIFFLKLF